MDKIKYPQCGNRAVELSKGCSDNEHTWDELVCSECEWYEVVEDSFQPIRKDNSQ